MMKFRVTLLTTVLFCSLSFASLNARAEALTAESLYGKWLYTHILMDGSREMKVNLSTIFSEDGSVVFYDPLGNERGRASFTVKGDTIHYEDANGPQSWKLVSLENGVLHVNHRGSEMFFKRQ